MLRSLAESLNMTGSGQKRRAVLVEETKTAFVQQNECHCNREQQELVSNIHEDNHIRSHRNRHCAFGLSNTLFSKEFAEDFAILGDVI